jgi:hypothetical protein
MDSFFIDPDLYEKHREEVLRLSNSIQLNIHEHFPAEQRGARHSDLQIADKLGLDERVVREIRVVAERDSYPIEEWQKAIEFKERACRGYAEKGVSYATKKYLKRQQKEHE